MRSDTGTTQSRGESSGQYLSSPYAVNLKTAGERLTLLTLTANRDSAPGPKLDVSW